MQMIPRSILIPEQILEIELNNLLTWSNDANLVFSSTETKLMVNISKQMKRIHNLDDKSYQYLLR